MNISGQKKTQKLFANTKKKKKKKKKERRKERRRRPVNVRGGPVGIVE